jgi:hypothetical protein
MAAWPTTRITSLLPLQPTTFHILLSLTDEDRHGYAIILEVAGAPREN